MIFVDFLRLGIGLGGGCGGNGGNGGDNELGEWRIGVDGGVELWIMVDGELLLGELEFKLLGNGEEEEEEGDIGVVLGRNKKGMFVMGRGKGKEEFKLW